MTLYYRQQHSSTTVMSRIIIMSTSFTDPAFYIRDPCLNSGLWLGVTCHVRGVEGLIGQGYNSISNSIIKTL